MLKKVCALVLATCIMTIFFSGFMFAQTSGANSTSERAQATQVVAGADALPDAPTGLDIFQVGKKIMLKWNFVKNARRYEIYRAGGRLGDYRKVGESTAPVFVDLNPNLSKYENYYKVAPHPVTTGHVKG